MDTKINLTFS